MKLGPDASRYILAGRGERVARPFNMRWLLPAICGDNGQLWWAVWLLSWPAVALGAFWWAYGLTGGIAVPAATAGLLVALPGLLGPAVVRPVGVDLPAMAVTLIAAGFWTNGYPLLALIVGVWAACMKESQPVWLALWVWSPWPLVLLAAPLAAYIVRRPAIDQVTANATLRRVHDHPIRSALEHRAGRWRDGWLMVAPWGLTLLGLVNPTPQVIAALVVAHLQLLVATDTVRLVQTAAGPVMALAAAMFIPTPWLLLAVIVAAVWWRTPELV